MKVLVVHAHPEPPSFTAALKDREVDTLVRAGHDVVVSDLYAEGFAPVAGRHDFVTVADEQRFSPDGAYGSIEQVLWPTQHCMVEYPGLATAEPFVAHAAPRVDDARRAAYLDAWSSRVRELESLVDPASRVASVASTSTSWASPV